MSHGYQNKNAGETILMRASKMGYPDSVAYAVGMQDMSVKEKDYAGFTPLDKAAFRGHSDVVKILLQYGSDPSSGVKGTRALHDGKNKNILIAGTSSFGKEYEYIGYSYIGYS